MPREARKRVARDLAGFTLVELLVAAFIVATTLAAAYHVFQTCLEVWKRGDSDMRSVTSARLFCLQLGRELSAAAAFGGPDGQFKGEARDVAFTSLVSRRGSDGTPRPCSRIRYEFVPAQGEARSGGYVKRSETLAAGGSVLAAPEAAQVVLTDVQVFALSYLPADSSEWSPTWEEQDKLPRAVRLTLRVASSVVDDVVTVNTAFNIPVGGGHNVAAGTQ